MLPARTPILRKTPSTSHTIGMKNYFPFTDYDFYAYLTSGVLLLTVFDFVFNDAEYLAKTDWTLWQVVVGVAFAYVTGHVIASFSQLVLETFFVNRVIAKPMQLQLATKDPNNFEKLLGGLTGRYYGPMSDGTRARVLRAAATIMEKPTDEVIKAEDVFLLGHQRAFSIEGGRQRLDEFRNQYGFCRNVSFVGLLATCLFAWQAFFDNTPELWLWAALSLLTFVGMFVRFLKFLSSFQAEAVQKLLIES